MTLGRAVMAVAAARRQQTPRSSFEAWSLYAECGAERNQLGPILITSPNRLSLFKFARRLKVAFYADGASACQWTSAKEPRSSAFSHFSLFFRKCGQQHTAILGCHKGKWGLCWGFYACGPVFFHFLLDMQAKVRPNNVHLRACPQGGRNSSM